MESEQELDRIRKLITNEFVERLINFVSEGRQLHFGQRIKLLERERDQFDFSMKGRIEMILSAATSGKETK